MASYVEAVCGLFDDSNLGTLLRSGVVYGEPIDGFLHELDEAVTATPENVAKPLTLCQAWHMLPGRREGSTTAQRRPQSELMPRIDPAIREVVVAAGRGINPMGMKGRVGLGPPYNPYFSVVIGLVLVGVGAFVGWQLRGVPLAAILLAAMFGLVGVWLLAWSSRRVPAWHRARRAVAQYLIDHPGRFPPELRWFH